LKRMALLIERYATRISNNYSNEFSFNCFVFRVSCTRKNFSC
jgi:hypothetical protein